MFGEASTNPGCKLSEFFTTAAMLRQPGDRSFMNRFQFFFLAWFLYQLQYYKIRG